MSIVSQCGELLWIHFCTQEAIDRMQQAIDYARDHDVLLMTSAGNNGPPNKSRQSIPVVNDGVIAVSGMTPDGAASPYQDASEHTDIRAPGHQWIPAPVTRPDDPWGWGNGTSGAAALVSGLAATLLSAGYSPDEVQAAILASGPDQMVTVDRMLEHLGPPFDAGPPPDDVHLWRDAARARSTITVQINYGLPSKPWHGQLRRTVNGGWAGTVKRELVTDWQHACDDHYNNNPDDYHRYSMPASVVITASGELTLTPTGDVIHEIGPDAKGACGTYNLPYGGVSFEPYWVANGPDQIDKPLSESVANEQLINWRNPSRGGTWKTATDSYVTVRRNW